MKKALLLSSTSPFSQWRVTWSTLPPSLKTLRPFVHDLRIITVHIDYHWKCLRGHCACAESRDPWVGGQKRLHFGYPRPRFAYSLCNFRASTMKVIKVVCENHALPCIKRRMSFCTCAKSPDLLKVRGNWKCGVPYFRVSRIFMSRIFHPCNLVPKIHVSYFPPLHSGAANSCLAFSTLAFWCHIFMSRNFMSRIFSVPKGTLNVLLQSFSPTSIYPTGLQKLSI